jgi:hypothetical protein
LLISTRVLPALFACVQVQEFGAEVGRFWSKTIAAASQQQQQIAEKLQQQQSNWRNQQQQQQRGVDGAGTPRSVQLAGSASQAGQQLWSGLSQAGQQLRATTSKLAQAAAAKTGGSGPRFGSISLGSMALGSSSAGSNYAVLDGEGQQPQQERNGSSSGPTQMGAAAAGDASNSAGAAHLQRTHGVLGSGDRGSLLAGLGAQPKLSKQYRLSGGGPSASLGAGGDPSTAAAAAAAAAAASSGGEGRLQPCVGEGEGLLPFLSVEEGDPFVSLVGEDDGPDDEQQRAAVENAVLHSPAGAAVAAAAPK